MLAQSLPLPRRWRAIALGLQGVLILLFQQPLSVWGILLCLLLVSWSSWRLWYNQKPLTSRQINLLLAPILLLLFWQLRSLGVLNFMFHVLLLSAIARSLSISLRRDAVQMVWVQYFAISCSFIFYQQMFAALFIFCCLGLNGYLHYQLFGTYHQTISKKPILKALAIAMPIWLLLFIFFPRLPPLWQMPNPQQAITGLGNELDPGSIEQLVQNDALAFRVSFNGPPPARQEWYWRAKIYEDFDGRRWQVNRRFSSSPSGQTSQVMTSQATQPTLLSYQVLAEPSFQRALFTLGIPQSWSEQVLPQPAGLLSSVLPLTQRFSYRVEASLGIPVIEHDAERQLNLHVPSANPKTIQFAQSLQQQYLGSASAIVSALATHFRQNEFFYSLTPPRLTGQVVDQFLFETRTGFCSHYASATALILRAAGIPARVVGGYQGGDWQQSQQYLIVRQREAHAWVEYLDEGKWHRFDPTAAIAPERILEGIESALNLNERELLLGWQPSWLQQLALQWSHLDYFWSVWVLGFNQQKQFDLFAQLKQSLRQWQNIVYLLCSIGFIIGGFWLIQWWQKHQQTQHNQQRWRQKTLSFLPTIPQESMPVSTWLTRLAQLNPEQAALLEQIKQLYEKTVFAAQTTNSGRLLQLLRQNQYQLKRLRTTEIDLATAQPD